MDLLRLLWKLVKLIVAEALDTPRQYRVYAHTDRLECLTLPADDRALIDWLSRVPGITRVRVSRSAEEGDTGLWLVVEYVSKGDARVLFGPFTDEMNRLGYVQGRRFYLCGERVRK
jgi:hypothetical protein